MFCYSLVSEFEVKDPDQTQKYETHLEQSSCAKCNSEKYLKDDKDEKVSENIIPNSTSEETSCELDATKQFPIKNVPETPLSPAQITSIVNGGYTIRPLYRAFLDLEENSLVCDVIYEEDELNYEDDLSETSDDLSYINSMESDIMSIEDGISDNINRNEVFDNCNVKENIITDQYHSSVYERCELESTPVHVKSFELNSTNKMDEFFDELPASDCENIVDEYSSFKNPSKVLEKNFITKLPNTNEYIIENEFLPIRFNERKFSLNMKDSKINENVANDAVGSEEFDKENNKKDKKDKIQIVNEFPDLEEINYCGSQCLVEEVSKPQTKKEKETRCMDVFRYVLRRLGNLLLPCLRTKD
ncbi:uncharacterized protein LOC111639003 [Centruroides sculpturatus]|uniref:uncharacterized protein LOC111639003 n=1 Tax=Centruroides sculpturatus TaxID=218467 RepID=UPI000C6E0BEA|nr:uncharacterized protein LOC111639003 [Centruroides sculpturatus]